ncbi:MAG: GNAT family N-acetyltransferase [Coriobacteriia bacterium]|nr:GNAT family N-acetyltransferase [Coriobacteriia bacterium]
MKLAITHAAPADAASIAAVEAACFPLAEAASEEQFAARVAAFPNCFWLARVNDQVIAFIDGMTSGRRDLTDDMFADPALHDPEGAWLMIFGVATLPEYQGRGVASALMKRVLDDCATRGMQGAVLTCKPHMVPFYARFGFADEGLCNSQHGGAQWHQMRVRYADQ